MLARCRCKLSLCVFLQFVEGRHLSLRASTTSESEKSSTTAKLTAEAFVFAHVARKLFIVYTVCVGKLPFQIAKTFASALAYVVRELFHVDVVCPNCYCCYMCWKDYTIQQKVCMHCITWQNISKQNIISSLFSHHCALCVQEKGGLVVRTNNGWERSHVGTFSVRNGLSNPNYGLRILRVS